MNIYYVNGKFVPENEAVISVTDLSVIRGYGIFDFIRTYNKKPFYIKEHLKRFIKSGKEIGMDLPWSAKELENLIYETISKNDYKEYKIRILATGGESIDSIMPSGKSSLIIMVSEFKKPPQNFYTKGVKLITTRQIRFLPGSKSLSYISAVIALKKAHKMDAVEVLYIDEKENVLEGATCNIFAFSDKNELITPEKGILTGITRDVTIKIAKEHFKVSLRDISLKEILKAKEVFITSSTKEIVPVVKIDDNIIGQGVPDDNTKKLMQVFSDYAKSL
jgi:branched-chain amino acid aminotransferase